MSVVVERPAVAKKRSEQRKHASMMRVDEYALERAKLAASLMKKSLADYASEVLLKAADRDIAREAKKLVGDSE